MGSPGNAVLREGREREGARELPWDRSLEAGKSKEGASTPLTPLTSFLGGVQCRDLPLGVPPDAETEREVKHSPRPTPHRPVFLTRGNEMEGISAENGDH